MQRKFGPSKFIILGLNRGAKTSASGQFDHAYVGFSDQRNRAYLHTQKKSDASWRRFFSFLTTVQIKNQAIRVKSPAQVRFAHQVHP